MLIDRPSIRCGAFAAALVLLLASCSGSKQSVSAAKTAPRGDVAICAKYEDNPTRRAQCLLLTGPNKHEFIPEIGRRADLDAQVRCHPVRSWPIPMLTASGSNPRLDRLMRTSGHRLLALQPQPPAAHLLQWGQRAPLLRNLAKRIPLVMSSPLYPTPKSAKNSLGDRSPSIPAGVHALTTWIAVGGAAAAEAPTVGQAAALRSATTAT
jgi:hypothetical protein